MVYRHTIDTSDYVFNDLRDLLAKATPPRSGDRLAGISADSAAQMIAARIALADVPLKQFLHETVIPYEDDEITRLIIDTHDTSAFAAISALTVGSFRDWLLSDAATSEVLKKLSRGITPEMAAAVSKLMRNQDLILVAKKCEVTSAFRNTIGLRGRMSVPLQPNHPFDDAHHGVDQQTCEARAYAVARAFDPLLVNSVVGFIGPEYLYDGKEIIRAGLEDHFCGKLLGLPLGVDVCYTNHAEADQDDMDNLLTLLAAAGVTFIMGVPGADDVMLNYQSTSFHDALYVRDLFGLKPAPDFDDWLFRVGLAGTDFRLAGNTGRLPDFSSRMIARRC